MSQIEPNGKLSKFFSTLKHCGYNLSYNARLAAKKLLDLLLLNIETYGTQSTKYNCVIDQNNFQKVFLNISPEEIFVLLFFGVFQFVFDFLCLYFSIIVGAQSEGGNQIKNDFPIQFYFCLSYFFCLFHQITLQYIQQNELVSVFSRIF